MTPATLTRRFVVLRGLRWMPLGILLPFIILLPLARGLSLTEVGAVWALHSFVALAFEVPSGALADGYGRRRALAAGATLMSVALVVYAFAVAPVAFAAATAALAAGRALISGALEAWYVDTLRALEPGAPLRQGLARGSVADGLGLTAGALMGGFLPLAFGGLDRTGAGVIFYTPVTLIAAAVAAAYLVAVLVLVDEPSRPPRTAPVRARVAAIAAETRAHLRGSLVMRTVLVVAAAGGIALSVVELLWQPRLADLLGDADEHSVLFGLVVAATMAAGSAGAAMSPRLNAAVGSRNGYGLAVALAGTLLVAMAVAGSPATMIAAYLLLFVAFGLADPLHFELLHEATTDGVRATVMSTESLASQGGGIAGNLVLAAVAGASGVPAAWIIAGTVLGLTSLLVLRLPRTHGAVPATTAS